MSKKHFEMIAAVIKAKVELFLHDPAALDALNSTVESLCNEFQRENPRFNRQRFFQACGL